MSTEFKKYLEDRISISENDFIKIKGLLVQKNVRKGEFLTHEGDMSPYLFFVIKGCLRSCCTINNKEYVMQIAPENWWISDRFTLHHSAPSTLNISAIEDSVVLRFNSESIDEMEKTIPGMREMFEQLKENRYQSLQKRILSLISTDAIDRYEQFVSSYPIQSKRVPLQMIASYLGLTPQSLSRLRSKKRSKSV